MARRRVNKKDYKQKCFNIDLGKAFTLSAMLGLVSFAPQAVEAVESDINQAISLTNDFTNLLSNENGENISFGNKPLKLNADTQNSGGGSLFRLVIRGFWRLYANSGDFCIGG